MTLKEERYQFFFDETMNQSKIDLKGLAIGVCPEGFPGVTKNPCLLFMSEEREEKDSVGNVMKEEGGGDLICHAPFGCIKFKAIRDLEAVQYALNILQKAIHRNQELKDEVANNEG